MLPSHPGKEGMARYITRRLLQIVFLFFVFLTLTFFLLQALPGDIVAQTIAANPELPPEAKEIARARLGLDKPLWEQYITYLSRFLQGDLGVSFSQFPRPVADIIAERLPRTVVLFTTAILLQYYVGFIVGKYLAWRRNKRGELAITVVGTITYTAFYPWVALMMIWFFGGFLGILPLNQFIDPIEWRDAPYSTNEVFITMAWTVSLLSIVLVGVSVAAKRFFEDARQRRLVRWGGTAAALAVFGYFWVNSGMLTYAVDIASHMVLPVATLTLVGFAGVMLLTRSSMLETMKEDYVLTARAKGLPESKVRNKHSARTALLPVTTSLVLAVALVIDGGIVTETVFTWPGMGQLLVQSVVLEDIPLALGAFSFVGIMALVGHLIVDITYGFLDPRIRVTAQG